MTEAVEGDKARKKRLAAERIADELNACILGLGEVDSNALHGILRGCHH